MGKLSIAEFTRQALPFLKAAGQIDDSTDVARVEKVLAIVQEKVKLFEDLPNWTVYLLKDDFPMDADAVSKTLKKDGALGRLAKLREKYSVLAGWTVEGLESGLKGLATELSVKTGELIHPCRVAVSGKTVGPSLYHMLEVLGKERVLDRLDRAAKL
jgi:glutamyl-tRNA synthetase